MSKDSKTNTPYACLKRGSLKEYMSSYQVYGKQGSKLFAFNTTDCPELLLLNFP